MQGCMRRNGVHIHLYQPVVFSHWPLIAFSPHWQHIPSPLDAVINPNNEKKKKKKNCLPIKISTWKEGRPFWLFQKWLKCHYCGRSGCEMSFWSSPTVPAALSNTASVETPAASHWWKTVQQLRFSATFYHHLTFWLQKCLWYHAMQFGICLSLYHDVCFPHGWGQACLYLMSVRM